MLEDGGIFDLSSALWATGLMKMKFKIGEDFGSILKFAKPFLILVEKPWEYFEFYNAYLIFGEKYGTEQK